MSQIFYENDSYILKLNGTNFNCTLFKSVKSKVVIRRLFQYLAPIILILGVIGNSLGLYCAMRNNIMYIRVYLTRVFHAVNLVNYIFMLFYPILDLATEYDFDSFRYRLPWNAYMVHYHFVFAKTFFNFSFGVYVIFGISQMIALVYPYYYKRNFTRRKIKIMIAICFLYCLAWYIPSAWWYQLLILKNLCGFHPNIVYTRTYTPYESKEEKVGWIVLDFFTEIFTLFVPMGIILVLNYFSLKHKRSAFQWRLNNEISNLKETSSMNINNAAVLPQFKNISAPISIVSELKEELPDSRISKSSFAAHMKPLNKIADVKSDNCRRGKYVLDTMRKGQISKKSSKVGSKVIDSKNVSHSQRKMKKMELEYKLSIRMLTIFMFQCVVLLFPLSIYVLKSNFYETLKTGESDLSLAGGTILEYTYISVTFYLNIIFNPAYRENVYKVLRYSKLGKFCNKWNKTQVVLKT
ncbi:unnamed protein product [Gordionus sp. m RMFG-2023]